MLNLASRTAIIVLLLCSFVGAQTPSSAVWPLTASQVPMISGEISASNQSVSGMQISYSNSLQRSSPSGTAGTWPSETAENTGRYLQFAVMPLSNVDLTVASVSMKLSANSGSNMKANVYFSIDSAFLVKTQIGTTFALASTAPASANVTSTPNIVVSSGKTFYVRIYPWYAGATTGKYLITNEVTIVGTTINNAAPLITVPAGSLQQFPKTISGSAANGESYTFSAVNLVADAVVIAPPGFKVSKDSISYFDSISYPHTAGMITAAKVHTRFAPAAAYGSVEDGILHRSPGADPKTVSVTGISLATEPTTSSVISFGTVTGNSIAINFTGGNGGKRIIVMRKDSAVSFSPSDGGEISGVDSNFSLAVNQGDGNKVVYDGSGSSAVISGLSVASTYHFVSVEYNVGTSNSHNYLLTDRGTGNATTLAVAGLNIAPGSLSFGSVVVHTASQAKSYSLSGSFLTPAAGNLTVTAPAGFEISATAETGFDTSLSVPYTGSTLSPKSIFVRFKPSVKIPYAGSISHSGGGAVPVTVSLSGSGVDQIVVPDSLPFGFASLGGGTTGGKGGTEYFVTSGQQLAEIMLPREKSTNPQAPIIIYVTGILSGYSDVINIKRTKNVSILGVGTDAKVQGFGFKIVESSNIIVRNITFADAKSGEKDAVSVEESYNVWIDHCSFTDSPSIDISGGSHDGQLDVKKGSYNVTLSYNYFTNHRKTCLLGHSPTETGDVALRITYYRNWFDGTYSRHPRARYGKAHIINNLYTGVGIIGADAGGYAVGSTCSAHLLVEGNYFENTSRPTLISQVNDPEETLSGDPAGFLKAVNNVAVGSGPIVENLGGFDFDPAASYSYTALDAQLVKEAVKSAAGAGKIDGGATTVRSVSTAAPLEFTLYQNFPNPFNPSTVVQFSVPVRSMTTLKVYNMIGQAAAELFTGMAQAGFVYSVPFDGRSLSSGMYLCVLESSGHRQTKRMVLLK